MRWMHPNPRKRYGMEMARFFMYVSGEFRATICTATARRIGVRTSLPCSYCTFLSSVSEMGSCLLPCLASYG